MEPFKRRDFLKLAGAASALSLAGCAGMGAPKGRVVVIGAGFGGATAAHYLRLWDPGIEVVMVERESGFTSCPMSNLVIGGHRRIEETQRGYDGLRRLGVRVVNDEAIGVDAEKRIVRLSRGGDLSYDRLIVSPGIDFLYGEIGGYAAAMQARRVVHAWKAGPQTVELRSQLERMSDGGVFLIAIPPAPYRCPPGPYERISQVASYLKAAKPRAKILALDANPDVTSKGPLFKKAWADLYPGMIEYRGQSRVVAVESGAARTEFETIKGDVLNVIPPHRAGEIAVKAGLITHNDRWCDVDWRTCESKAVKNVHVLGDATLSAPGMPKSGHMANQQAKVCAAAVIALMSGQAPNPSPVVTNTCYSYVSGGEVIHVASVHQWDTGQSTLIPVKGAGGVSSARNELEAKYAWAWAQNIWSDMFG